MYGILVRDKHLYDYFVDYIKDNRFVREGFLSKKWIKDMESNDIWECDSFYTANDLFIDPRGRYFLLSLVSILGFLGLICIFGLIYEKRRKWVRHMSLKSTSTTETFCLEKEIIASETVDMIDIS